MLHASSWSTNTNCQHKAKIYREGRGEKGYQGAEAMGERYKMGKWKGR